MARRRPSPWAAFHEQQRASARKYNDLRNQVGRLFQDVQHEAQEQWVVWDEALGMEGETDPHELDDRLLITLGWTYHIPKLPRDVPSHYPISIGKDRFRHTYVIGKAGSGKSTFLKHLIAQDLANGNGVIVISSEDYFFETHLLPLIPTERKDDLIYFNPTDTTDPVISFNPFRIEEGENLVEKAGQVYLIFERAVGDIDIKISTLLQNCVYALLQREGSTIFDFFRLINPRDNTLRCAIIADPTIDERTKNFWAQYNTSNYDVSTYNLIINRLDDFFRPPLAKILFTTSSFSFREQLNAHQRILFCNLSRLSGLQTQIVGQLLVTQIQQALRTRDFVPEDHHLPYFCYMDDFETYTTASEQSLIELFQHARKYKMGFILAHQTTAGIPTKLISTIIGNVGTIACFQPTAEDASYFAQELQLKDDQGYTRPDFLQNLALGQAVIRTPVYGRNIPITIPIGPPDMSDEISSFLEELFATSKGNYGQRLSAMSTSTDETTTLSLPKNLAPLSHIPQSRC